MTVKVSYKDYGVKIKSLTVAKAVRYSKLTHLLRNPIEREQLPFKVIVDTMRDNIEADIPVENMDLMAFRELCIMISSLSSDKHSTAYQFQCDNLKTFNYDKDSKQLYINSLDEVGDKAEILKLQKEVETMPDEVPCNHQVTGDILYSDLKEAIDYLEYRETISDDKTATPIYSYSVAHRIALDDLEHIYQGKFKSINNLGLAEDITKIVNFKKAEVVIFDLIKIALHLLKPSDLQEDKIVSKYNELVSIDIVHFQNISKVLQDNFNYKPKRVQVKCDNCGKKYKLVVGLEDFNLTPV